MLWKYCIQYAGKFGKLSSGHRTGKGQFSFQSQRKVVENNVHSTTKLYSFHMLASNVQNSPNQTSSSWYVNHELPDVQVGFRKGRGTRDQMPTSIGSSKKQESSRKTSTSALLIVPKLLTVNHNKLWKILKQISTSLPATLPDHFTCLLRNLYAG